MSEAQDRLALTRRAILEQIQRRHPRRHTRAAAEAADWEEHAEAPAQESARERSLGRLGERFAGFRRAVGAWWRHHPAHMGLELATPVLSRYAARKPVRYVAIASAAGAVVMVTRPWRLISATGLVMALIKSSQLSSMVMSALSAADYRGGGPPSM